MRLRLLLSAAIMVLAPAADAATFLWNGGSTNYDLATNWTPNGIPAIADTAEFSVAAPNTAISTITNDTISALVFDPNPLTPYSLNIGSNIYAIVGSGVSDAGNNAPSFTVGAGGGQLNFFNFATAADINITDMGGQVNFNNNSTAGTATINENGGATSFSDSATAAGATINVQSGSVLNFNDTSTAANSTINDLGGTISLNNSATLGAATVNMSNGSLLNFNNTADGGTANVVMNSDPNNAVDFSGITAPNTVKIGSISGGLNGFIFLGANKLSIGGNNSSTTLDAVIADCSADCTAVGAGLPTTGGVLNKVGTGTLTFTADNTYTGGTIISAGTLQLGNGGTTGSVTGNIANSGALVFNHSNILAYGGVISGAGSVTQNGSGGVSFSAAQTYSGPTTISAGTLALTGAGNLAASSVTDNATFDISGVTSGASIVSLTGSGGVALGAKTLTLSNAGGTFSGVISGTGGLTLSGGKEILTGSSPSFTGATIVNGGTLSVNGSIKSSAVTVNSGGTLGGTGTVGPTTVQSGGTLAPGNSIGTINVAGNLVFNAGSTYHVELSPTANDKTLASGTASLNGTVLADFQTGGSYIGGTRYTLVTSTGALSGTFSSLSSLNLPGGLTASLSYDANDAYLTLLGGVAQDGLIHATLVSAYAEDERLIRDAVLDHLTTSSDGVRVWGEGFAAYGIINPAANPLQHNHAGFIAGVDMPVGAGITAGIGGAWTGYKASMASKTSSATGETGHVLGYLGWADDGFADNGGVQLKAGGEYGWGAAQTRRVVSSTGETDAAHEGANTAQIFGEAAFRDHFLGADLEPHADIFWVMAQNGAFAEKGGSQAMSGSGITADATYAKLGVRGLGRWIDLGGDIAVAPSLDIGWQMALSNPTPGVTVGFATGTPTLLTGTPAANNAGTAELGMAVKLGDSADLHIGYDGIFSSGEVDHAVTARLEMKF